MFLTRKDHDIRVDAPWTMQERSGSLLLVLLVPAILLLDYTAGRDISLQLLYLLPIGLAAWSFGARAGYAVAAATAAYGVFVVFATRIAGASAATVAWGAVSTLALFLFFAFVVARHRRFVDDLVVLARIDNASGALSRREFARLLEAETRRARRYQRPLAIAMLEAADAKELAARGREFLPAVVRGIQAQVRDSDAVGRVAERRLGVILVECPAAEAFRVAARIREHLGEAMRLKPGPPGIGLVSYAGTGAVTAADLLQLVADQMANAQDGPGISENRIA